MLAALFARLLSGITAAISQASDVSRPQARLWRVLLLLGLIAALCLVPLRLSPHSARVVAALLLGAVALGLLTTVAVFRRLLARVGEADLPRLQIGRLRIDLPNLEREVRVLAGAMALIRRAGVALPALLFFCVWAVVYLLIWAHSPAVCPADPARPCDGAFLGAGAHPTFGDFLYYSVNMAFANPAPDLVAHTRAAHTAATIEVLSGVGLVTLYAGVFFGLAATATPAAAGIVAGAQPAGGTPGTGTPGGGTSGGGTPAGGTPGGGTPSG